jgi:Flp pilus assembly protein TadG
MLLPSSCPKVFRVPLPFRAERGQDAVEFAIMLPLLLLVMLGVADFGRVMYSAITITNAAREGARFHSLNPANAAGTFEAVVAEAAGSGIDLSAAGGKAEITISCPDAAAGVTNCPRGTPVRVQVTYTFDLMSTALLGVGSLPVNSYAEMMVP